jgi:hypothetical protein
MSLEVTGKIKFINAVSDFASSKELVVTTEEQYPAYNDNSLRINVIF